MNIPRIRLLFFTSKPLSNVGGGERVLAITASNLSDNYDVTVVTPYDADSFYKFSDNVKIENLGFLENSSKMKRQLQYFQIIASLRKRLKKDDYDYFIASTSNAVTFTSLATPFGNKKLVAWMHNSYFAPLPWFLKLYDRHTLRKFKVISTNSMDVAEYKKHTKEVVYIPNALMLNSKEKSDLTNKRIIAIGRMEKGKALHLLINICAKAFNEIPDWTLDIFGQDQGEKENLLKQIENLGMKDRIIIHQPTNNITKEYVNSSIFAMTSRMEAFCLAILEACECGVPCISYNVPSGPRDLIEDGYNGYLISDLDEKTYVEKLTSLMNSYEKRKQMGNNAVLFAKKFEAQNINKYWDKFLNS